MATIVTTVTTPNSGGINYKQLVTQIAIETGFVQVGTVVSGAKDYLVDETRLQSAQLSPSEWIGGWTRISETTDLAAPQGEIVGISDFDPEQGKVYFGQWLSEVCAAGDTYELWKINPYIFQDIVNACLTKEIMLPCWTILSHVADADMEQSHTTDWTSGGSATVSKQSAAPRLSDSGSRYLRVVSSTAGGYAKSNTLYLEPGGTYQVSAVVRAYPGYTAKLQLWDETNGAEIASKTSDRTYPVRVHFSASIPATCNAVTIRLMSVEASATTEWDDVGFFGASDQDIPLPWWVQNKDQVEGIFELSYHNDNNGIQDAQYHGTLSPRWNVIPTFGDFSKFKAVARMGISTHALYMFGTRYLTEYSDEITDIKYVPMDLLVACIKYKLYQLQTHPMVSGIMNRDQFGLLLVDAEKKWHQLRGTYEHTLENTLRSPDPWGKFIDQRFTFGESY